MNSQRSNNVESNQKIQKKCFWEKTLVICISEVVTTPAMLLHCALMHKPVSRVFDKFLASRSNESYNLSVLKNKGRGRRYSMEYKESSKIQKRRCSRHDKNFRIFHIKTEGNKMIQTLIRIQSITYKFKQKATHKPHLHNLQTLFQTRLRY